MADSNTKSYWLDSSSLSRYPKLEDDLKVDVVVVGGGITGLTAAYLLKRQKCRVAVIERDRIGGVDSSRTTAHVTCVTDLALTDLVNTFGREHAQAAWDAGLAGIDTIDGIIRDEDIDCEWTWVSGYKYAASAGSGAPDIARLRDEAALAAELGFDARYLPAVPFFGRPGIEFPDQAKFHPRTYLATLARLIDGEGSHVFEHTACEEVAGDPLSVTANGHRVTAGYLVLATHTPLMGKTNLASATLFQTKLYLYTSYAVGGTLPHDAVPEALFWGTNDPYDYLRVDRRGDHDYAIFGGNDHKTGQTDGTEACFRALEDKARTLLPGFTVTHRWSGQVVETNDGLPFIGETSTRQFAATGYSGNGMTFGTLAGMMACDRALSRQNPWAELFDVGRTKVHGGLWDYLKENADYPDYMIRDRFAGGEGKSVRSVRRGEGRILDLDGERVAVWRNPNGQATRLSPTCTHMGCQVGWNASERTWDCPCHGSRFKPTGQVLSGPAESPLTSSPEK
jgi:glycine/D-amino acid oxidase-like deaminating enzyme/nitrite reductase/ring-hydroxylating ferredoxin subunit